MTLPATFVENIHTFDFIPIEPSWSFTECKPSQTRYITHGYHTYPAKFIPQLAARLITELSHEGDIVCDPFMGSGTTMVEAIVNGRHGVGVDINPSREYGLFGVAERNLNQLANIQRGDICFYYTSRKVGRRAEGVIYGPFEVVSEIFRNSSGTN